MRRPQNLAEFLAMYPQGAARPEQESPIPAWVAPLQGRAQELLAVNRANRPPSAPNFPIGPGAIMNAPQRAPFDGPPAVRAPFSSVSGDRPALGQAQDWINPTPPLPRPSRILQRGDEEPWRSPIETDRMAMGGPAYTGGFRPLDAPPAPASTSAWHKRVGRDASPPADDLDAAWGAALERARAAQRSRAPLSPAGRAAGLDRRR